MGPGRRRRGLRRARHGARGRHRQDPARASTRPRYADPSLAAAQTFAQRLAEAGITVDGRRRGGPRRRRARASSASCESAPLRRDRAPLPATRRTTRSPRCVARLVAIDAGLPATFEGGDDRPSCTRSPSRASTPPARASSDASGLGARLGAPARPRSLGLLRLATDPAHGVLRDVATGMPIAGLTGTLSDRYTQSPARGLVRAKTGSLPHVTSLAGHGARRRRPPAGVRRPRGRDARRRPVGPARGDRRVRHRVVAGCGCRLVVSRGGHRPRDRVDWAARRAGMRRAGWPPPPDRPRGPRRS